MQPKVIARGEGSRLNVLGSDLSILVTGADSDGRSTLIEQTSASGSGVPLHVHANEDETLHVLEGSVAIKVGNQSFVANAGTTVFAPRGIPHEILATGGHPATVQAFIAPAGLEKMFEELGALPPGKPDLSKVAAICGRYGVTFL